MLASGNDDPNGISRLDRAKLVLEKLVDKLENDKVGMVIFAGQAKMQLPITVDYSSAKMYINDLTPDLIAYQGTDISTALEMAMRGFSPAEDVSKAIILITDAENHDGDAVEVARMAAEKGIQVDVISSEMPFGSSFPDASIEFEMSNAIITSMPRTSEFCSVSPARGRAKTITSDAKAISSSTILIPGLYFEVSGISGPITAGLPNLRSLRARLNLDHQKSIPNTPNVHRSQSR